MNRTEFSKAEELILKVIRETSDKLIKNTDKLETLKDSINEMRMSNLNSQFKNESEIKDNQNLIKNLSDIIQTHLNNHEKISKPILNNSINFVFSIILLTVGTLIGLFSSKN